ncbi:hypothetical protein [Acetobacter conturbans]|uniref:Uncharacterized protein n=1 Tax=Acetobacter conturbans TaxID=1737472 RepID=A0ABX0K3L3_9PROT|nr:hypothetical protein [Acetobacter conturbans]NHN89850.1 hypothetical protein [Acetobacter conturbans]
MQTIPTRHGLLAGTVAHGRPFATPICAANQRPFGWLELLPGRARGMTMASLVPGSEIDAPGAVLR